MLGYALTVTHAVKVENEIWAASEHAVKKVQRSDHLFVLIGTNVRTGKRGKKSKDTADKEVLEALYFAKNHDLARL